MNTTTQLQRAAFGLASVLTATFLVVGQVGLAAHYVENGERLAAAKASTVVAAKTTSTTERAFIKS
jgi:hypothetical protein